MTISGYSGNNLISYKGQCRTCGMEDNAYYIYAYREQKEKMLDGKFIKSRSNCVNCKVKHQLNNSMVWYMERSRYDTDRDLKLLENGINIDYDAVDSQEREEVKLEEGLKEEEWKVSKVMKGRRGFTSV